METKRLIMAIVLCGLIFPAWIFLSREMGWTPPPAPPVNATAPVAAPATPAGGGDIAAAPAEQRPAFAPTEGRLVTVDTPLYTAVLHSQGGVLREFRLKHYKEHLDADSPQVNMVSASAADLAPLGLVLDGKQTWASDTKWQLEGDNLSLGAGDTGVLRFIGEQNGVRITRELTFSGAGYVIAENLILDADSAKNLRVVFSFASTSLAGVVPPSIVSRVWHLVAGGEEPKPAESQHNHTRAAWFVDGGFKEDSSASDLAAGVVVPDKVSWMGVMSNYFLGAVSMPGDGASATARLVNGVFQVVVGKSGVAAAPGSPARLECSYFIGPKEAKALAQAPNHIEKSLDYGWFTIIAKPLVVLLQFLHSYVGNYGVAIILMTILIKMLFWPLSQKSYKSMEQMRKLQPLMQKIREKHADDREATNREVMQLYKTYKVNPAGGCLPILVQIPVFIGLYQALLNSIELRHAPFITHLPFTDKLWLADLSAQDPYCITPLVMGATMLLQQKMTPTPGDPTQAKIMMMMPLIFTVLFINFPAGLVVYWLVNNVISIAQQWFLMRRTKKAMA